jgi:hypothetical protein
MPPGTTAEDAASTVAVSSDSKRRIAWSTCGPSTPATSSPTFANSSRAGSSSATSVATRRSAACSSARRASSMRASVFAIAVLMSSMNWASRETLSGGSGRSCAADAIMQPQRRPATTTGTPIEVSTFACCERSPIGPEAVLP